MEYLLYYVFSNHHCCVHRSHRSEYEVNRPKLHLLQLQQSRSGRRRRWSLGSAQPSRGHGGEAAHRRIPGVRRLPAPLCRRAGKPDPAAELSPSQNLLLEPVHLCRPQSHTSGRTFIQRHKGTRVMQQCTVGPVGMVPSLIPTCLCIWTGQNISQAEKCLFMHLVHFDLSALLSVAIHPIQFILPLQPPFVSGSDDLCEGIICIGAQRRTRTLN